MMLLGWASGKDSTKRSPGCEGARWADIVRRVLFACPPRGLVIRQAVWGPSVSAVDQSLYREAAYLDQAAYPTGHTLQGM